MSSPKEKRASTQRDVVVLLVSAVGFLGFLYCLLFVRGHWVPPGSVVIGKINTHYPVKRRYMKSLRWWDILRSGTLYRGDTVYTPENVQAVASLANGNRFYLSPQSLIKFDDSYGNYIDLILLKGSFDVVRKGAKVRVAGQGAHVKADKGSLNIGVTQQSRDVSIDVEGANASIKKEGKGLSVEMPSVGEELKEISQSLEDLRPSKQESEASPTQRSQTYGIKYRDETEDEVFSVLDLPEESEFDVALDAVPTGSPAASEAPSSKRVSMVMLNPTGSVDNTKIEPADMDRSLIDLDKISDSSTASDEAKPESKESSVWTAEDAWEVSEKDGTEINIKDKAKDLLDEQKKIENELKGFDSRGPQPSPLKPEERAKKIRELEAQQKHIEKELDEIKALETLRKKQADERISREIARIKKLEAKERELLKAERSIEHQQKNLKERHKQLKQKELDQLEAMEREVQNLENKLNQRERRLNEKERRLKKP